MGDTHSNGFSPESMRDSQESEQLKDIQEQEISMYRQILWKPNYGRE